MPGTFFTIPRSGAGLASPLAAQPAPVAPSPMSSSPLAGPEGPTFQHTLGAFLDKVDHLQHDADAMVEAFALGEPVEVHQVVMALGEAQTALDLTLQVRNKVLEAYQEVMRTQI